VVIGIGQRSRLHQRAPCEPVERPCPRKAAPRVGDRHRRTQRKLDSRPLGRGGQLAAAPRSAAARDGIGAVAVGAQMKRLRLAPPRRSGIALGCPSVSVARLAPVCV